MAIWSRERGARPIPARPWGRGVVAAILSLSIAAGVWTVALAPADAANRPASNPREGAEADANEPPRTPNMIRFGPEQGLSRSVNDLAIDRQGYVWIATADGLARYDGAGFRHWRYDPMRSDSLPANNAMVVLADGQDRIWVATSDTLSVLNADRRGFRHLRPARDTEACVHGITAIREAHDGGLWVGTVDGEVCKFDLRDGVERVVENERLGRPGDRAIVPFALYEDARATLWIGTREGLLRRENGELRRFAEATIGRDAVLEINPDVDGDLWVGAKSKLYRIGAFGRDIETVPGFRGGAIVLPRGQGGYWIGADKGLYKTRARAGGDRTGVSSRDGRANSGAGAAFGWADTELVQSTSILTMRTDRDGGLWVSGIVRGLSYLSPDNGRFVALKTFGDFDAQRHDVVAVTGDDTGRGWLLTEAAIYRLSPQGDGLRLVRRADELGIGYPRAIESCFGKLWVAGDRGIATFGPDEKKSARLLRIGQNDPAVLPSGIRCSKDRRLWVSFFGGALRAYSEDGTLVYAAEAEAIFGRSIQGIVGVAIDTEGVAWYTDDRDLFRWNGAGFDRYRVPAGDMIHAFAFSSEREVWVVRSGALERYRRDGGRFRLVKRVGPELGMPLVESEGMIADASGRVWLTTMRGLLQYDPVLDRARMFGIHDGLPGTDFYYGPPVRLGPHRAVALSADGLAFFDPARGLEPAKPSPLSIESLTLRRNGEEVALDPNRPVRILAGDRDLRVVPRLLSFSNPLSHRYRSRLRGEDSGWVVQEGPSERVFSTLPPGRYTLELQAANADGAWSAPVSLSIEAMPPWWRTAWAMLAYVLLASAFLWCLSFLDRLRLKRRYTYQMARQKRELAEQASEAKSRFLADLGHELRTPMTGVLGMSELLLASGLEPRQHGQAQSIRRAGEHLLRLVDDALDLARVEAGRLELQRVEFGLDALTDEIANLMSPLAARKGLRFCVERDPKTPDRWLGYPLRLKQIVLNLLGNAVKFTERGSVGLKIEATVGAPETEAANDAVDTAVRLRIDVWDTGPGMTDEQVGRLFRRFEQAEGARTTARYGGTGLGLAISRELAVAMGGDIATRSALGEGTTFVLTLPLRPVDTSDGDVATQAPKRSSPSLAPEEWYVVLLVEDDPTVAEVLTGLLQGRGHRVVHAAHGLAAMTEAAVGRFDAAFVDLDLPGIDGCALAEQLRASGFAAPMIAITARADAQAEAQAQAAGFAEFMRKPTTGERLQAALRRALAAAQA